MHIQDEQGHVTMDALGAFFNSRVPSNPVLMLVHVLKALEHTFDEQVAKIGTDGLTNILKDLEHTLKQEEDCEPRSPVMPNGNPGTALILGRISTLCKETMAPIINLALKMAFVVEAIGIPEMQDTPELEALALLDGFIAVAADIAAACKSGVPCIGALSRLDQLNLPAISFNPMAVLKNFNDGDQCQIHLSACHPHDLILCHTHDLILVHGTLMTSSKSDPILVHILRVTSSKNDPILVHVTVMTSSKNGPLNIVHESKMHTIKPETKQL